ncbi:MAG: hypothetical protein UFJ18_14670 [Blautia sp.]|nr:hypothetical protein [Blautia sp.]
MMKKKLKRMTAFILTGVMVFQVAVAADTTYVSGDLNRKGDLVQYNSIRTHVNYGSIGLSVNDMPYGYLRLGLRNMSKPDGPQFSRTIQWDQTGTQEWTDVLAGVKFALQGRMKATSNRFADNTWGGTLFY